jgi:hypothetical protein
MKEAYSSLMSYSSLFTSSKCFRLFCLPGELIEVIGEPRPAMLWSLFSIRMLKNSGLRLTVFSATYLFASESPFLKKMENLGKRLNLLGQK